MACSVQVTTHRQQHHLIHTPWPSLFDRHVDESSRTRQSPILEMGDREEEERTGPGLADGGSPRRRPCYIAAGPFDIRDGTLRRCSAGGGGGAERRAVAFFLLFSHTQPLNEGGGKMKWNMPCAVL